MQRYTVIWGLTALLVSGCGTAPTYDDSEIYQEEDYGVVDQPRSDRIQQTTGNPAVKDLWDEAEAARLSGDLETAALKLERALRLAPDSAALWSGLAEVRLEQGNANQAENLAAKSNAMVVDNNLLNYRNWLIIARARKLRGDDVGAQEAEYTASSFKR